jgi:hypothetical protein
VHPDFQGRFSLSVSLARSARPCRKFLSWLLCLRGLPRKDLFLFLCLAGTPAQIHAWIRFGAAVSRRNLSPCSLVISPKHFPIPTCFYLRAKFPVRSQIHSWSAPAACFSRSIDLGSFAAGPCFILVIFVCSQRTPVDRVFRLPSPLTIRASRPIFLVPRLSFPSILPRRRAPKNAQRACHRAPTPRGLQVSVLAQEGCALIFTARGADLPVRTVSVLVLCGHSLHVLCAVLVRPPDASGSSVSPAESNHFYVRLDLCCCVCGSQFSEFFYF